MQRHTKLLLATLTATALLSLVTSSAYARRIAGAGTEAYRVVWSQLTFNAALTEIRCAVTFEGSFHSRTMSKVISALVGFIISAYIQGSSCTGGSARALTETLPWHIQYQGFTGTLPTITGVRTAVIGARFRVINGASLACLAGTTQANAGSGIANVETRTFKIFTLRADESVSIPLGGGFLCELAGNATFSGTAEVFAKGSTTTRLMIRLVQ